jgi:hypothetical protein
MRKAILLSATLLLVSGAAYGTPYVWINPATNSGNRDWYNPANWNQGAVPAPGDNTIISNGGRFTTSRDIVVGSLRITGGSSYTVGSYSITTKDNALTGAIGFYRNNSNATPSSSGVTNVYGSFAFDYGTSVDILFPGTLNLYGTNTAFRNVSSRSGFPIVIWGTGIWDNASRIIMYGGGTIRVKAGGSIGRNPTTNSVWTAKRFIFEGGQSNLPYYLAPVEFRYSGAMGTDNGTMNLAVTGGVTYPYDVHIGQDYAGTAPKTPMTWRVIGGAFTVAQDFQINEVGGLSPGMMIFNSVENGTANSVNFTVNRDMKLGTFSGTGGTAGAEFYKAVFNSSKVRIGNDFYPAGAQRPVGDIAPNGSCDLGNTTIRLGGNLVFANPRPAGTPTYTKTTDNWNAGTSTIICDGNGLAARTQTLTTFGTNGFYLNNLTVMSRRGIVQLDTTSHTVGDLILTGSLLVDNGTFKCRGMDVIFKGKGTGLTVNANGQIDTKTGATSSLYFTTGGSDCTTAVTVSVLHTDPYDNILGLWHIGTGSGPTFVQLATNVKVNGLIFDNAGCAVVLQGHTININGTPISTTISYGAGMIYQNWSDAAAIPEPGTCLLIGTGVIGLFGWMRRRRMK